jgi:hypothetical protein
MKFPFKVIGHSLEIEETGLPKKVTKFLQYIRDYTRIRLEAIDK